MNSGNSESNNNTSANVGVDKDGDGSWFSTFVKVAGAAAATATVVGGLYSVLSSAASVSSQLQQVPFGAQRQLGQGDNGGPGLRYHDTSLQVRWKKPEFGWVKLIVDGSRDHYNDLSAGCGGVLRDACGTWLLGFAKKLDPSTNESHQTELEAILTGLQLAKELKVEKLVVESDSDYVVRMVENGLGLKLEHPDYVIVQQIMALRFDSKWQVTLVSVPRTANRVANQLANGARKFFSDSLRKYPFPPETCTQLLLEDNGHGV